MKRSWVIEEFCTSSDVYIIIVQHPDADIIQELICIIDDNISYRIRIVSEIGHFNLQDIPHKLLENEYLAGNELLPVKESAKNIADLPFEILLEIFKHLGISNYCKVALVCKRFKAALELLHPIRANHKLFVGIRSLPLWRLDKQLSLYGEFVKSVEIVYGFSLRISLKLITQYCKNIRQISFKCIRFYGFVDEVDVVELRELLSGLEKVVMVGGGDTPEYDWLSPNCIFKSLEYRMNYPPPAFYFANLAELDIHIYNRWSDNYFRLISSNPQIRKLSIRGDELDIGQLPHLANLQHFTIGTYFIKNINTLRRITKDLKTLSIYKLMAAQAVELFLQNLEIECLELNEIFIQ